MKRSEFKEEKSNWGNTELEMLGTNSALERIKLKLQSFESPTLGDHWRCGSC